MSTASSHPGIVRSDITGLAIPADYQWLEERIANLTDDFRVRLISEWAEQERSLAAELTPRPGPWSNEFTPYLVEIMDRLHERDPMRKMAVMKAAQVAATTGILENGIGYNISESPCGVMYVSADKELTQLGIEVKVDRMLESCGLSDVFRPAIAGSKKSGNTAAKKEYPGGFLLPIGARNPGKLRSMSVKWLFIDELDGCPDELGEEGSMLKLAETRTVAFEHSRKIVYLSTPTVTQTSRILKMFNRGDQRYYNIPCKHCGEMQVLEWHRVLPDGEIVGITFDVTDKGRLIPSTVGYRCIHCREIMREYDKSWFLPRGVWIPTDEPMERHFYSYHISGLMSPPGMRSWASLADAWLEAWDVVANRCKDVSNLKTFYNTCRGLPFEERGEAPSYERIIQHRRPSYVRNEIPNKLAIEESGSPIHIITIGADVHSDRIDVEIVGWANGYRSYSIDWRHLTGDTSSLDSADSAWPKLQDIIDSESWEDKEGRVYQVQIVFIDARHQTDTVYQFCKRYPAGVYGIQGLRAMVRTAKLRTFDGYENREGGQSYNINTTLYKDRFMSWMRSDWNQGEPQPPGFPNYPVDYGDDFFKEYTAETKLLEVSRKTGQALGMFWQKMRGMPNHALDCRVYGMAALDVFILAATYEDSGREVVDSTWFWQAVQETPLWNWKKAA